jgi:hypothetical protein
MFKLLGAGLISTTCLLAAPAAAQEAAPAAPGGFAASFRAPEHDAGGYRTPNRDLSAHAVTWHVRVALNVAALGCRGADEARTVSAYNALIAAEKAALAAADAGEQADERVQWGAHWQDHHDDAQTKLYNFWAQPPAQAGFCQVAQAVLAEAAAVEPSDFAAFAAAALPRLEAPFLAAFATWDAYRAQLAAWQARSAVPSVPAAPVVIAAAAPVAVAAVVTAH